MKTKILLYFSIIVLLFYFGCSNNPLDPVDSTDNINSNNLHKKSWFTSPQENWGTFIISPGGTEPYETSDPSLPFSFRSFNFVLSWGRGSVVGISVNGTSHGQIEYYNGSPSNYNYVTDWYSFTHNGINIKVRLWIFAFQVYNYRSGYEWHNEPRAAWVQVEDYTNPDPPTGFSLTPKFHPGVAANPVLSWTTSSDGDVTHVEIWRKYSNPLTSYQLIATVSVSNSSQSGFAKVISSTYTDYTADWNLPTGRNVFYKIRFKDATHNLFSDYSPGIFSSSYN